MLPDKEDHTVLAKERLRSQWQDKPIINSLLESYTEKIQDVEDTAEYLKQLSIFNSTGEDLNRIGRLYDVLRNGKSDQEYRADILGRISATEPDASPEGIMESCRAYGQTTQVDLHEHFPCFTQVYMGEGFDHDSYSILKNLIPAATIVSLYVDDRGDSIVFSEESPLDSILVNDSDEAFYLEQVEDGFKALVVSTADGSNFSFFNIDTFAEEGDLEWHPFAEELNIGVLFENGNIVDESFDNIVDENGDNITYTDFKFKS